MKYLVVGLGNIGAEYENTRHNIGFQVVDAFVNAQSPGDISGFHTDRHASVATIKLKGRILCVIKPTTFMNLSGKAVNYWKQKKNIPVENILVITDDIALPFGSLRLRPKGSDGGHNGLKSITGILGTDNYPRLRFGVGNNFPKGRQVEYVLSEWTVEEKKLLPERFAVATEMIKSFALSGIQRTMNDYNNK